MGTALTVPTTERRLGIMNTGKVDISKAKASLAARGSSTRLFPGDSLNFKKGVWYLGFSKKDGPNKRRRVKSGTRYVMNLANAVETWQTFVDGRPKFAPLAYLINGESRAPREEMGQTDEDKWDQGEDGQSMDPVQAITVCPIREPKGVELHHITLGSMSSRIAFEQLLGAWLDQYEDHPGELPIVELTDADERTRKGSKQTYLVPTFEIVGWEKAAKIDNPGPGGIEVAQPDDAEVEDDEPVVPAKHKAKAKPVVVEDEDEDDEPVVVKSKVKAKAKPVVVEDEDEDDDEPAPDPRKGNGNVKSRHARTIEEDEAEEAASRPTVRSRKPAPVEEDEDDEPVVVKAKTKAKPAPVEDEDAPVSVRKRRPALH